MSDRGPTNRRLSADAAKGSLQKAFRTLGAVSLACYESRLVQQGDGTPLGWVQRSRHWDAVIAAFHRYEMRGRLGSGGMAEIFLAREKEAPHHEVAVKRLLPNVASEEELRAMFVDEARLGMRLTHPSLCRVYDVGDLEGHLCIAMEYVYGVTLADLIERTPNGLPIEVALSIIADVASALDSVHRARDEMGRPLGIVHRDVTPHNVMITYDGRVKLLDFGLAKSALNEAITRPGMAKGKFAYLAPELWSETKPDPRADIFSLGVCLYEALTGKRLYYYSSPFASKKAICDDPVPSVLTEAPKMPRAIDRIVSRCLAKRPDGRFESAGALGTALTELMELMRLSADDERIAGVVLEAFSTEHALGPKLEPTEFGKRASERPPPPQLTPTSVFPALPPTRTSVKRRARRRALIGAAAAAFAVVMGGVVLAAFSSSDEPPVAVVEREMSFAAPLEAPAPVQRVVAPVPDSAPRVAAVAEPAEDVVQLEPVRFRATAAVPQGRLSVNTRPWSEVEVDGRRIGITPLAEVRVEAGERELIFVDRDGMRHRLVVDVPANGEVRIFRDLTE